MLRVEPALGQWFTDRGGHSRRRRARVLSHGFWTRRFGANPAAVGTSMTLDGVPTEIVGVMPASFTFPDPRVDVWIADQLSKASGFGLFTHGGVARLRPEATLSRARADMTRLIADLPQAYPGSPLARTLAVHLKFRPKPSRSRRRPFGSIGRPLWVLFAAVGLVLAIACANLANLFLVRTEVRQRDVAVRRALGATGGPIARHFLAESLTVSAASGALGLALAWSALRAVVGFAPSALPRLAEIQIGAETVLFTVGLSALTESSLVCCPFCAKERSRCRFAMADAAERRASGAYGCASS